MAFLRNSEWVAIEVEVGAKAGTGTSAASKPTVFRSPYRGQPWVTDTVDRVLREKEKDMPDSQKVDFHNTAKEEGDISVRAFGEPGHPGFSTEKYDVNNRTGEIRLNKESRIMNHLLNVLKDLDLNINDPGLKETPRRVTQYLLEFCQPCDLVALLKTFDYEDSETHQGHPMVVVQNIPLAALCEHHLAPFLGTASIGYIPHERVIGLSKFSRLVHAAGRQRPTIQESLTNEIAAAINDAARPKGVIVVVKAAHTCLSARGVTTPGVITTTSAIKGVYVHVPAAREEFFSLLGKD